MTKKNLPWDFKKVRWFAPFYTTFSLPIQNIKTLFWCYTLNCRSEEFFASSFLFRKWVPHHRFRFEKVIKFIVEAFKYFLQQTRLTNIYWLVWSDTAVIVFILSNTFLYRIHAHSLLHAQHSWYSRNCHRPSLLSKRLSIFGAPIHLSSHFSVKAHHKGTLQPKLCILINLQDPYLSTTSNVNLP